MRRNGIHGAILATLLSLLAASCGYNSEDTDTTPPVTPVLKPRSVDSLYAETGIRPEAGTSPWEYAIRIEWYPNTEEDLAGYLVYRHGEEDSLFPNTPVENLILGQNFSPYEDPYFVDYDRENLQPNDTTGDTRGYYYAVRAYDVSDNISGFSDIAYYRLITNPSSFSVSNPSSGEYYLKWTYESGPEVFFDYFMIRVWDSETGERAWHMKYTDFGRTHNVLLNVNGTAQPFVSGRRYVWKLNVIANSNPPQRSPAGCAVKTDFVYYE